MTQRVHNGNVSFYTGFNGFGERITHTGTGPNGVFHTEALERDVLGRVRSQTHGSQAWNGQERWQGYEYDARHALSTSWEAWAPSSTAPSVGSHDTATNLSVASAAGGLGATASARERAPTLGSLQKIVQGAQDVWEAQRTATGHRLSEISDVKEARLNAPSSFCFTCWLGCDTLNDIDEVGENQPDQDSEISHVAIRAAKSLISDVASGACSNPVFGLGMFACHYAVSELEENDGLLGLDNEAQMVGSAIMLFAPSPEGGSWKHGPQKTAYEKKQSRNRTVVGQRV